MRGEGDERDCHFEPDGWERLTEMGTRGLRSAFAEGDKCVDVWGKAF